MPSTRHWCILCEGKSEVTYLALLSRFVRDFTEAFPPPVTFHAKPPNHGVGSGHLRDISAAYHRESRNNPRDCFRVWGDADLCLREKADDPGKFALRWSAPLRDLPFAFSPLSFEDFLSMHFPDSVFFEWKRTLAAANHFSTPLTSKDYLQRFHPFWHQVAGPGYEKGTLPDDWISESSLRNLFRHCTEPDFIRPVRTLTPHPTFPEFLHATLCPILGLS